MTASTARTIRCRRSCVDRNASSACDADRRRRARLLALEERRGLPLHVGCVLRLRRRRAPALARARPSTCARASRSCRATAAASSPCRCARAARSGSRTPHLRLAYHVRAEALPGAADDAELARLAGARALARGSTAASRCGSSASSSACAGRASR